MRQLLRDLLPGGQPLGAHQVGDILQQEKSLPVGQRRSADFQMTHFVTRRRSQARGPAIGGRRQQFAPREGRLRRRGCLILIRSGRGRMAQQRRERAAVNALGRGIEERQRAAAIDEQHAGVEMIEQFLQQPALGLRGAARRLQRARLCVAVHPLGAQFRRHAVESGDQRADFPRPRALDHDLGFTAARGDPRGAFRQPFQRARDGAGELAGDPGDEENHAEGDDEKDRQHDRLDRFFTRLFFAPRPARFADGAGLRRERGVQMHRAETGRFAARQ